MKIYISINPIKLNKLIELTDWNRNPDSRDIMIEDSCGNKAFVDETNDGRLYLIVDECSDISDILDHIPFHREND